MNTGWLAADREKGLISQTQLFGLRWSYPWTWLPPTTGWPNAGQACRWHIQDSGCPFQIMEIWLQCVFGRHVVGPGSVQECMCQLYKYYLWGENYADLMKICGHIYPGRHFQNWKNSEIDSFQINFQASQRTKILSINRAWKRKGIEEVSMLDHSGSQPGLHVRISHGNFSKSQCPGITQTNYLSLSSFENYDVP